MKNKNGNFIKKEELKFWLALFIMALGGIVAFVRLQEQVYAMTSREQANREVFYTQVEILTEVRDTVIRIEKDNEYIKAALGIAVD